jgi:CheY-like chemotaxis protein
VRLELHYTPAVLEHQRLIDPKQLRQLFSNLVGNAIKFTEAGSVRVLLDADAAALKCQVIDTGIGIAPEDEPRLFQRFSQLENALSRSHGGTGLGLAICKSIVQACGGQIGLSSRPGEGSTFWFEIPAPIASANPRGDAASQELAAARSWKVLVADDDDFVRRFLGIALESFGMTCKDAGNGEEAVRLAGEEHFDLIMLDIRMPGMSGDAAMRQIRDSAQKPAPRLVAFTGEGDEEHVGSLVAEGFDAVLRKPVSVQKLRDFLFQELRSSRSA